MKNDPFVELLKNEFKRKKARNQAYSLRSFSRDLGMDASNLLKILTHKKEMGPRLRIKLAKKMGFESKDISQLNLDTRDADYQTHPMEVFEIVASWEHYAILELFKLKNFQVTTKAVAKHLGLPAEQAKNALARLERSGLLQKKHGRLVPCDESSSSILDISTSRAHRSQQRQILEMAIDALELVPIERRSQSSMAFAIDSTKIVEARELIKKFRRDLGRFLSASENLDEVYHLSISLYPVTKQQTPEAFL